MGGKVAGGVLADMKEGGDYSARSTKARALHKPVRSFQKQAH